MTELAEEAMVTPPKRTVRSALASAEATEETPTALVSRRHMALRAVEEWAGPAPRLSTEVLEPRSVETVVQEPRHRFLVLLSLTVVVAVVQVFSTQRLLLGLAGLAVEALVGLGRLVQTVPQTLEEAEVELGCLVPLAMAEAGSLG